MDAELTEKIDRLETHLAHLEHQFEQLNQSVIEQGKILARLTKEQGRLGQTLETFELERIRSTPTKPPHYQ